MERVTGVGGVFFRSRDPEALATRYAEHLRAPRNDEGHVIFPSSRATHRVPCSRARSCSWNTNLRGSRTSSTST